MRGLVNIVTSNQVKTFTLTQMVYQTINDPYNTHYNDIL